MSRTRAFTAGWLILLVAILGTSVVNDHLSCDRADSLRAPSFTYYSAVASRSAQRAAVDHGLKRKLDLEARASAQRAASLSEPIDCSALLPGTR